MQDLRPLFVPTNNAGVTYWRMYNFVNSAQRNKIMNAWLMWWQKDLKEVHPWQFDVDITEHKYRIMGELDQRVRSADICIMQTAHTAHSLNVFKSIRDAQSYLGKGVTLAEVDDNIYSTPTYNPASSCYNPNSPLRLIATEHYKSADAMIVSTPYLKEVYEDCNKYIYVVPNCIDFKLWDKVKRKKKKGLRIGWSGGAAHKEDLEIILPVIKEFGVKYPEIKFVFLHGAPDFIRDLPNVEYHQKFARIDKYPQYVGSQGIDIGLAPLVDNAFNRGKSNLKFLEWSALSIPTVASNVGNFKETIKNGKEALLCNNAKDFFTNLETLAKNSKVRKTMGRVARDKVFRDFNVDEVTRDYEKILREVYDRGQILKDDDASEDITTQCPTLNSLSKLEIEEQRIGG